MLRLRPAALVASMGQTPPSARHASALQSELIVATRDDDTLRQWTEWRAGVTLDTVTELRPGHDGNLVVYNSGGVPIWASGTANNPGAWLAVQDDGNLVIYDYYGFPIWAR